MTAFPYDRYPGVDANHSFPPEVRQSLADSQEFMSFYATKDFINIRDFGAQGDGVTDDAPAIQSAIGAGHNRVYVPPGTYMLGTAILLKDYTELFGAGIDISVLKLLPSADQGTWVVTNADRLTTGNTHMWLHDITCDWDISRLGGGAEPENTGGGSRSSCVNFAYASMSRIDRVKAINAGLHGFDVSQGSYNYPYNGDMPISDVTDKSDKVWIDNCEAKNFGDDGFTTHHSDFVFISNSFAHQPRKRTNNNAFEVDDGSRFVTLTNNTSYKCYAGIEIKAHGDAPAASGIVINGHIDLGSVRSYNWRHIGHHSAVDPRSLSAYNIIANNLVSINPKNLDGFQDEATPRALNIAAYQNVSIDGLMVIGNDSYTSADSAITVNSYADGVSISGLNIRGFGGAGYDVYVDTFGSVSLDNVNIRDSAVRSIYGGANVSGLNLSNLNLKAGAITPKNAALTITAPDSTHISGNVTTVGYRCAVYAHTTDFPEVFSFINRAELPPAGNLISQLLGAKSYYLTTARVAAMTDKPSGYTGPANVENVFLAHDRNYTKQIFTAVSTTVPDIWYRIITISGGAVGAWKKITAV